MTIYTGADSSHNIWFGGVWPHRSVVLIFIIIRQVLLKSLCLVAYSCPTLQVHGLQPPRLLSPWGISRQEHWRGLLYPSAGDLPHPGIEPRSPTLQADSSSARLARKPEITLNSSKVYVMSVMSVTFVTLCCYWACIMSLLFSFLWWFPIHRWII